MSPTSQNQQFWPYFASGLMACFGQHANAVQPMRSAIAGNYCSYIGRRNAKKLPVRWNNL